MSAMKLDPARTRVAIEVDAEGAFARFAHDLRLEATGSTGTSDGTTVRASFPIRGLHVVLTSRHGKNVFRPPSEGDASDIERRVRDIAFEGGESIDVMATRDRIEVIAPRGRQTTKPMGVSITEEDGAMRIRGSCTLSLSALKTRSVSMPLGAVKLRDDVRIDFDVVLV